MIFDEISLPDLSVAECSTKNANHSFQVKKTVHSPITIIRYVECRGTPSFSICHRSVLFFFFFLLFILPYTISCMCSGSSSRGGPASYFRPVAHISMAAVYTHWLKRKTKKRRKKREKKTLHQTRNVVCGFCAPVSVCLRLVSMQFDFKKKKTGVQASSVKPFLFPFLGSWISSFSFFTSFCCLFNFS